MISTTEAYDKILQDRNYESIRDMLEAYRDPITRMTEEELYFFAAEFLFGSISRTMRGYSKLLEKMTNEELAEEAETNRLFLEKMAEENNVKSYILWRDVMRILVSNIIAFI